MDSSQKLQIKKEGHIATLSMVQKTNILGFELINELICALEELNLEPEIKVVILTGNGAKSFIAGADIKTMQKLDVSGAVSFITSLHTLINKVRTIDKVVIAAINGHCFGGGLELAICCDFIIASENATFGMQEVALGIPSVIEAALFPFLVGIAKTREFLLLGQVFDAPEALSCGLINRMTADGDLLREANKWAEKFADNPPHALAQQKHLINRWLENAGFDQSVKNGIDAFGIAFGNDKTREILSQAFKK